MLRPEAVRAYVSAAMGLPAEAITAVAEFDDGNRHGVYRVSYRDSSEAARDVVARICYSGDATDLAQAEREAAVLESVGGVAAPELYDFRPTSEWFETPAMCMQFVPGHQHELHTVASTQIEQLAVLVAWVHARPVDGLIESMGATTTIAAYADYRLRKILATLAWARDPLPNDLQERLRRAADALTGSFAASRESESFDSGATLSLLHGDIGPGNVLWNPGPCLIDWEYARLGDPADELAYTLDQNGLSPAQRRAFWDGYRQGMADPAQLPHIVARADWWEPVTLLGSTLWWVERWVRRTEQDSGVPREPEYYLGHVLKRLDRLDALTRAS